MGGWTHRGNTEHIHSPPRSLTTLFSNFLPLWREFVSAWHVCLHASLLGKVKVTSQWLIIHASSSSTSPMRLFLAPFRKGRQTGATATITTMFASLPPYGWSRQTTSTTTALSSHDSRSSAAGGKSALLHFYIVLEHNQPNKQHRPGELYKGCCLDSNVYSHRALYSSQQTNQPSST